MVKYCPRCGAPNEDNALFCSKCGWQFPQVQQIPQQQPQQIVQPSTQPIQQTAQYASQASENIIIGNREITITKSRRVGYLVGGFAVIVIGIIFTFIGFAFSRVYCDTYLLGIEWISGFFIGFGFAILMVGYYLGKTVWVTK
jgi:uncharacterized membrane protein YvbJ